jgi:hypothetical protein
VTEQLTKEERLILYFETTTPEQFLTDITRGIEPPKQELQIIQSVRVKQKLPDGVINIILDLVLRHCDMKLSKSYVEKIASHWVRKKILTVKQAMEQAKKEHKQWLSKGKEKLRDPQIEKFNKDLEFELKYVAKMAEFYGLEAHITQEIIRYSREVNQGLMIYWFMDRVAEFINIQNSIDENSTKKLIKIFHEKYVVPFGR